MEDVLALVDYWRRCLADVDLRSPDLKELFAANPEDVRAGGLPAEVREAVFKAADASRPRSRERRPGADEELPPTTAVLVAPVGLRRLFHHGTPREADAAPYFPLWIPARLHRATGELRGTQLAPWIGREFLSPVHRDVPVLGKLEDLERFLTQNLLDPKGEWQGVLGYADRMLEAVTGQTLDELRLEDFEILPPVVVPWSEDKGMARAILILYDQILKARQPPPLLCTLARGAQARQAADPYDLAAPRSALRHWGQMSDAFPLSPSQRQALHGVLELGEGSVLAVNGPPGTGKTTFLQSVVASLWVEAALARAEPPVVVACSTNNQAVTNILDSFVAAAKAAGGDLLAERWLPELTSYGLYLPAHSRLGASSYLEAVPGKPHWSGLPAMTENLAYLERARPSYLDKARRALPGTSIGSVEDAVRELHARMLAMQSQIAEAVAAAQAVVSLRHELGAAGAADAVRRIEQAEAAGRDLLRSREELRDEVLSALESIPFWEDLLSFLPPVRKRRERRLALPFLRRHLEPPAAGDDLDRLRAALAKAVEEARRELDRVGEQRRREEGFTTALQGLGAASLDEPGMVLDLLDRLRYRLFLLAGRYWEGRWLSETSKLTGSDSKLLTAQSRPACEARLRRFAMLTPCLVATFHQAAKVFVSWDWEAKKEVPLFSALDLLIVDEAGQSSPEIGAAAFSLAKRALVVGDVHQIEPVWSILPFVDFANLKASGAPLPADPEGEEAASFRSSRGSVMLLARRASALACEGERGLFLSEHRRCVPEVIRYCNELVYGGRLQPLRPAKPDRILPALGWAHVTSPPQTDGGSRANPGEAGAIAEWLGRHRDSLEEHYRLPIGEIVAVITPFVGQRYALEKALKACRLTGVQAGTVHTFQGAERPVVLFSPVYSLADAPRSLFFDAGANLLNVAVSRAKDSFLVFGDLRVFDPTRVQLPSGKLASLLFESPENEIGDVESAQHLRSKQGVRRLSTLEEHQEVLREALARGKERVLIVSPYLSIHAVEADGLPAAVAAARARGIEVVVVFCQELNTQRHRQSVKALEALERAGAALRPSVRIHSKTLAVDGELLVEGSFNWLSAMRDRRHFYQRQEASLLYRGPDVAGLIETAWREALERRG